MTSKIDSLYWNRDMQISSCVYLKEEVGSSVENRFDMEMEPTAWIYHPSWRGTMIVSLVPIVVF